MSLRLGVRRRPSSASPSAPAGALAPQCFPPNPEQSAKVNADKREDTSARSRGDGTCNHVSDSLLLRRGPNRVETGESSQAPEERKLSKRNTISNHRRSRSRDRRRPLFGKWPCSDNKLQHFAFSYLVRGFVLGWASPVISPRVHQMIWALTL